MKDGSKSKFKYVAKYSAIESLESPYVGEKLERTIESEKEEATVCNGETEIRTK